MAKYLFFIKLILVFGGVGVSIKMTTGVSQMEMMKKCITMEEVETFKMNTKNTLRILRAVETLSQRNMDKLFSKEYQEVIDMCVRNNFYAKQMMMLFLKEKVRECGKVFLIKFLGKNIGFKLEQWDMITKKTKYKGGILNMLLIDKQYQGRGFGSYVMEKTIESGEGKLDFMELEIDTDESKEKFVELIKFYEKFGFQPYRLGQGGNMIMLYDYNKVEEKEEEEEPYCFADSTIDTIENDICHCSVGGCQKPTEFNKEERPPSPPITEDKFKYNSPCVCEKKTDNDYPCLCDDFGPDGESEDSEDVYCQGDKCGVGGCETCYMDSAEDYHNDVAGSHGSG